MCFSAEASFAVGAALLPAGAYCIRRALQVRIAYLPLAVIPVVFAIQQIAEGFVWLGLGRGAQSLVTTCGLAYLFFALVFWPVWVPCCVAFVDSRRTVKVIFGAIAVLALAVTAMIYVPLALKPEEWLRIVTRRHSIQYDFSSLPVLDILPGWIWHSLYLATVMSPLFASPDRRFTVYCLLVALAAGISHLLFAYALTSVWCMFAAILSAQLCYIFYQLRLPAGCLPPAGQPCLPPPPFGLTGGR